MCTFRVYCPRIYVYCHNYYVQQGTRYIVSVVLGSAYCELYSMISTNIHIDSCICRYIWETLLRYFILYSPASLKTIALSISFTVPFVVHRLICMYIEKQPAQTWKCNSSFVQNFIRNMQYYMQCTSCNGVDISFT